MRMEDNEKKNCSFLCLNCNYISKCGLQCDKLRDWIFGFSFLLYISSLIYFICCIATNKQSNLVYYYPNDTTVKHNSNCEILLNIYMILYTIFQFYFFSNYGSLKNKLNVTNVFPMVF